MNFGDLPEGCIAKVISLTTPLDACRLSVVSPAFRSAADSDIVWNEFLPLDYVSTVSRYGDDPPDLMSLLSKKQLFLSLCDNPILIDDGTKSFWLDKKSGKKCYMIGARGLMIVWGETREGPNKYWDWTIVPDSRFNEVAELWWVRGLEIRGKIDTYRLSPATTYIACLVFKIRLGTVDLGQYTSEVSVGAIGGTINKSAFCFNPRFRDAPRFICMLKVPRPCYVSHVNNPVPGLECTRTRNDGWLEIELGEYFNGSADVEDEILEMSLVEVKEGRRCSLIVQGIEIRPKSG